MTHRRKFRTLEDGMLILRAEVQSAASLSMAKIVSIFSGKGQLLILILLSLPFCQPIHIPGLSTPFGLVIAFVGLRIVFGKGLWLPRRILRKNVPTNTLERMIDKTLELTRKIKPWIHPRWSWLCHSPGVEKMNGMVIFILGVLLALPLPIPLSNMTAAWSIFLIALGALEEDGVFVLSGYLFSLLTAVFFVAITLGIKTYFFPH